MLVCHARFSVGIVFTGWHKCANKPQHLSRSFHFSKAKNPTPLPPTNSIFSSNNDINLKLYDSMHIPL